MTKEYRKSVAAIILSPLDDGKIWIGERVDKMAWGFPQGGIEGWETAEEAIERELNEELALTAADYEIFAKAPAILRYDFPADMTFPTWTYAGQEQQYFLLKLRLSARIDISKNDHEFSQFKFLSADEILAMDFGFKNDVYHQALHTFKDFIK